MLSSLDSQLTVNQEMQRTKNGSRNYRAYQYADPERVCKRSLLWGLGVGLVIAGFSFL